MLAVLIGMLVALAQSAHAQSAHAQPAPAEPALKPCRLQGLEHEAQCGVLKRPLDPAVPAGVQIDLHYAVIPALARNKKPDPVFFFAGGPGQSAIDLAGTVANALGRFGNRRDIVLIDQRGTGRSAPLKCSDDETGRSLSELMDPAQQIALLAACRAALQRLPYGDLRFFTTTIAMHDADAVRQALGAERIDAIGGSYGTRDVLEYMRLYPQHVRRAVLDGVAPPDLVLPAAFSADNQAAFDAVFAACEGEPACAARYPHLHARWEALLAGVPKTVSIAHPVTGRLETVVLTRDALLSMVRTPLYVPALASALPEALWQATEGHFEGLLALSTALQGKGKAMSLAEGMHFSVVCSEDFPLLGHATDAPGADFGITFSQPYRALCPQWPKGAVSPDFYRMPPAPAATLVLSGSIDPATPPRHGAHVAQALGARARHVVVPNAGHGAMQVPCIRDAVFRFVDAPTDDDALKVDVGCAAHLPRPPAFRPIVPAERPASGVPLPPAGAAKGGAR